MAYSSWDAAVTAGLDLWKWETMGYPLDFMERVIAFVNQRRRVRIHEQDALNIEQERRAKQKGSR